MVKKLLLPAFLTALCALSAAADPIRIGAVYPLSGDVAAIGHNIKRGIDFAVEEINIAGGINGRPIEIVWGDSQGSAKTGMAEAERLIVHEEVSCLLGAYHSVVTEVVAQTAERYQTPLLTAISTANILTTRGYRFFFRLAPTSITFLKSMMQFVHDLNKASLKGKLKTVAVLADNTMLGQEMVEWAKYWCREFGYTVTATIVYKSGASDLTAEVTALKTLNPDILLADAYIADCILLTKTMARLDFKPGITLVKGTGFIDPTFIPNVGALANGITTALEWAPDMTRGAETNKAFYAQYGVDMNGHSANAYTAVWVLKTAIEQAGTTDREKIRETLDTIKISKSFPNGPDFILPYDTIEFIDLDINGVGHTNLNHHAVTAIAQIQNGRYVTVWPFNQTKATVIYPAPYQ